LLKNFKKRVDGHDDDINMIIYRWAPDDAMDTHPDYLKVVFKFILNAFEECEKELRPQGRSYSLEQTKEEVINQTLI